jgi:excisionase family DNA binding protein
VDKLMTRREAAEVLRVSTRTLDRWLRGGHASIRAKRLGRAVRVSAEDVERLTAFSAPSRPAP